MGKLKVFSFKCFAFLTRDKISLMCWDLDELFNPLRRLVVGMPLQCSMCVISKFIAQPHFLRVPSNCIEKYTGHASIQPKEISFHLFSPRAGMWFEKHPYKPDFKAC